MGLYFSRNWVGVLHFGIRVTLDVLPDSRKLTEFKRHKKS